jgi:hypothetical protein
MEKKAYIQERFFVLVTVEHSCGCETAAAATIHDGWVCSCSSSSSSHFHLIF